MGPTKLIATGPMDSKNTANPRNQFLSVRAKTRKAENAEMMSANRPSVAAREHRAHLPKEHSIGSLQPVFRLPTEHSCILEPSVISDGD